MAHVLGAVRELNRLELAGEAVLAALNALAEAAPEWLRAVAPAEWAERYHARFSSFRLPRAEAKREALALAIGADGALLLRLVFAPEAPPHLRRLGPVEVLRRIWVQQYVYHAPPDGSPSEAGSGELRWRAAATSRRRGR